MLRRAVVFVAVVWAVAGSFVLTELLALEGMDLLLDYPVFDRWTLSEVTRQSTSCETAADRPATPLSPAEVRVATWLLGLNTGRDAVARNWTSTPDTRAVVANLEASADEIARFLRVPRPDPFVVNRIAEAYREFAAYVESSDRTTAVALARQYGPQACTLYKFSAYWGYSSLVRAAVPGERGVFALEVRHHARQLDLPPELWTPLTQRTPADASPDAIIAEVEALTQSVMAHLQQH